MPYAKNSDLPASVKIADENGLSQFRHVVNSELDAGKPDSVAFAAAWSTLQRNGYQKGPDGVWHKKEDVEKGVQDVPFTFSQTIAKIDNEERLVYGWASVIEKDGQPVTDHHGDQIDPPELVKAAHSFISSSRAAKAMHKGEQIGEFVESMVFTGEIQKALGIDLGKVGWFVGMKVHDDQVWKRIKSGELAMMSIGGKAKRV